MRDDRPDGWFRAFACRVSDAVGSHWAFFTALGIVLVWGITGQRPIVLFRLPHFSVPPCLGGFDRRMCKRKRVLVGHRANLP